MSALLTVVSAHAREKTGWGVEENPHAMEAMVENKKDGRTQREDREEV